MTDRPGINFKPEANGARTETDQLRNMPKEDLRDSVANTDGVNTHADLKFKRSSSGANNTGNAADNWNRAGTRHRTVDPAERVSEAQPEPYVNPRLRNRVD